jgi:benzoylformate decarboxylase
VKAKVIEQYKLPFPGIDTGERTRRERWLQRLRKRKADLRQILVETAVESRSNPTLDPAYAAHAITNAAPENTLFIGEGNGTGMWLWSYIQEQYVIYPDRMATIGLSLAWAFAATLAHRTRPCWILCGDGSLGYQFELFNFLAEQKQNIVVFLFHNGTWDSIRLEQTFLFAQRYPGTELPDTDYVGMAAQAGWQTERVTRADELDAILHQARERNADDGPLLVDIQLQPDSIPFAGLSFALAELDYILKPKLLQAAWSLLCLKLRGRMPWRILWMIGRLFL